MKNIKLIKQILIVLVVLILFGIVYYIGRKTTPKEDQNNIANTSATNSQINEPNNTSVKSSGTKSTATKNQVIPQPPFPQILAQDLVRQTWGDCLSTKCNGYVVTVDRKNVVTAIYNVQSETVYQLRKQAVAIYKNGTWKLGETITSQECWHGYNHADGTQGFGVSPCI